MSLSSDDGSLDDHLESDGLADDCDDSMMIKALPSRPQRGELPGFDRLQTVIVSHDAFVLELQLQYLQQLTEDIEIFEDVGMTDHMKSFIILKSVQCQDNISEAKSVLVSEYWSFFTVISILNPDFCTVHRYISD
jgi:hypothetical protein